MKSTSAPASSGRAHLRGEQDRCELDAAIAMVAHGYAVRVIILGLEAPEAAAAALDMTAADDGVGLDLEPTQDGSAAIVVHRP